jgi:hypothetical protein
LEEGGANADELEEDAAVGVEAGTKLGGLKMGLGSL